MPVSFEPAKIDGTGLFISIAGGSRSGKTVSALRLARGIAGPEGKIFGIDTEGRRMSHHSKRFKFDVFNMGAPYEPERFADAAESAQQAGAAVLICDSFSLEWNGIGGVLWRFEQEFERRNKNDKWRDACWNYAKEPHRQMRNRLMALSMPIIFCSRCNEVAKHLGGGWKAEQDQRWLYEWTVALSLHPDGPGMPNYDMKTNKGVPISKIPDDLAPLFPPGRFIGEAAGECLQLWRNGKPFKLREEEQVGVDKQRDGTARLIDKISKVASMEELNAVISDQATQQWRERLSSTRPELEADIKAAVRDAGERVRPPAEDDEFPGDRKAA